MPKNPGMKKAVCISPKRMRFITEYLTDLNATKAAIRAGYPEKSAAAIGGEYIAIPVIANEIAKRIAERTKRVEITQDRVVRELAKLAFLDARKFFDADGKPIAITELDDETAGAIAGLDVLEEYLHLGKGERVKTGSIKKYRLSDKRGALELLGKHLGMFANKVIISGDNNGDPVRMQYSSMTQQELEALASKYGIKI